MFDAGNGSAATRTQPPANADLDRREKHPILQEPQFIPCCFRSSELSSSPTGVEASHPAVADCWAPLHLPRAAGLFFCVSQTITPFPSPPRQCSSSTDSRGSLNISRCLCCNGRDTLRGSRRMASRGRNEGVRSAVEVNDEWSSLQGPCNNNKHATPQPTPVAILEGIIRFSLTSRQDPPWLEGSLERLERRWLVRATQTGGRGDR